MYANHFLRRTKGNIFTVKCAETAGRPLKMTELPLKTDLVIWLPLNKIQIEIYDFLLKNQDLQQLVADREIKNAFFILQYIKKLCLHPFLVASADAKKRNNIGLLCPEEQAVMKI